MPGAARLGVVRAVPVRQLLGVEGHRARPLPEMSIDEGVESERGAAMNGDTIRTKAEECECTRCAHPLDVGDRVVWATQLPYCSLECAIAEAGASMTRRRRPLATPLTIDELLVWAALESGRSHLDLLGEFVVDVARQGDELRAFLESVARDPKNRKVRR